MSYKSPIDHLDTKIYNDTQCIFTENCQTLITLYDPIRFNSWNICHAVSERYNYTHNV